MILCEDLLIQQGSFSLGPLSLTIPTGKYAVLMGETGCGKTSLLESIVGLRQIASGKVIVDGVLVNRLPPAQRQFGYVPQDGALFTTMTVAENLSFALMIRGVSRREQIQRQNELAQELGITHLLSRMPANLSGGEKQRVALGRALAHRPKLLLLDEPLSSLDQKTRSEMIEILRATHAHWGLTVLHVTHHNEEADRLAQIRFRLNKGILMSEWTA
ncbi:MAG: ABC transporter ATP-binding protein [Gemmataceae bacterium]|jgi:ABC-type sugar transport system ATPase subunit|nr:ABC transporter ATP-binding protein [Gemmataceae bacterium]